MDLENCMAAAVILLVLNRTIIAITILRGLFLFSGCFGVRNDTVAFHFEQRIVESNVASTRLVISTLHTCTLFSALLIDPIAITFLFALIDELLGFVDRRRR